mgnify:CR=1 FL=1
MVGTIMTGGGGAWLAVRSPHRSGPPSVRAVRSGLRPRSSPMLRFAKQSDGDTMPARPAHVLLTDSLATRRPTQDRHHVA